MNVLLNASTIKYGGGLSVTLNILQAFEKPKNWDKVVLIIPNDKYYRKLDLRQFICVELSPIMLIKPFRPFLDRVYLPRLIKKHKIDLIFSMGNLPIRTKVKQGLLFDNSFITAGNLNNYNLSFKSKVQHLLRRWMFFKRLKYVEVLFPQTNLQKVLLLKYYPKSPALMVVPNTYSQLYDENVVHPTVKNSNDKKLLVFSRYYEHKNLEILLDVAKLFKKNKVPYRIFVTINEHQGAEAKKFISKIKENKLDDYLCNLGEIEPYNLEQFYDCFDAVLLPSLLESYSSIYPEAIRFQKIVFTSDRNFAREVLGELAVYFDPTSAVSIFNSIQEVFETPELYKTLQRKINNERDNISSWEQLSAQYMSALNELNY